MAPNHPCRCLQAFRINPFVWFTLKCVCVMNNLDCCSLIAPSGGIGRSHRVGGNEVLPMHLSNCRILTGEKLDVDCGRSGCLGHSGPPRSLNLRVHTRSFHGKVLVECGLSGRTMWVAPSRALIPSRQSTTEYLPTFLANCLIRKDKTPCYGPRTFAGSDLGHFFRHQDKWSYLDGGSRR